MSSKDLVNLMDKEHFCCENVEVPLLFHSTRLSQVGKLCLWNGVLVSLSLNELTGVLENSNSEIILFKIFHTLFSLEDLSKEESAVLIAFSRTLLTWAEKSCEILKLEELEGPLTKIKVQFDGAHSIFINQILNYVYSNWDHSIDSLRHHSKAIFQNIIICHSLSCDKNNDIFLSDLTKNLLNLPWHCKGRYGALCHLVPVVKASVMLTIKPSIIEELVYSFTELSLAPHVSEFFTVISKSHHCDVTITEWQIVWLDPIIKCLCLGSNVQKSSIQQYVLPKLLQIEPKALKYLVYELASSKFEDKERSMCVTIACVKTAKCNKIPYNMFGVSTDNTLWKNCLPFETIKLALCHTEEQVRLDALSVLCDSPKSTEPLTPDELNLLQFFIKYNLNIQSPAFRQKMVSLFKKMLNRIKLSSIIELRKMEKIDDNLYLGNTMLSSYLCFLHWLNQFLVQNLFPEANFPRRCTVLQLLVLLNDTFRSEKEKNGSSKELQFHIKFDSYFCRTLWDLLRDTYENNKESVLELLNSVPLEDLGLNHENAFTEIMDISVSLASSSRPPDSVTAAYIFKILSKSDICILTASKFCNVSTDQLMSVPHSRIYALLRILVTKLEDQLSLAYLNLLQAASNGPLYGIILCIRKLLETVDLLNGCNCPEWRDLIQKIIENCLKGGLVVQPVVCNASPEGHLPMDTDPKSIGCLQVAIQKAIGRRFTSAVVATDDCSAANKNFKIDLVKTKAVTAQMLLLCSWRTHKEVSLLLGLLTEKCSTDSNGLVFPEQFLDIGTYFTKQLAEIKHRGAFEQAYVGFTQLCYRLWRCENPKLHSLPEQWLKDLIDMISENRSKTDSSTGPTRRSAGVPFIVQALLVSEPESTNRKCFKKALPDILNLTELRFENEEAVENSRIHSMNVLRALYRDAHLGEDIMPFVSDGIKAAVLGFKSKNWGVRNSATLLFTTLVTRVFGVNRSRREPQKKNCLTGRVFFQRFPELFEFLLSELQFATENLSMLQSSALHPILLLLSRLYPSPVEGSCSYVKLTIFIPLVRKCASKSPVWWTRRLASQAVVPLIPIEEYVNFLDSCFVALSKEKPHNENHGLLLQM